MMSENVQPAEGSNLPSSPLKPSDYDERNPVPSSSPAFRPAGENNLTVDLKKLQQPAAVGRKSLGRRVSFAATAHVRLYEKGETDEESTEGKEEDLDFRPLARKMLGSPAPASSSASSPHRLTRLHESVNALRMDMDIDSPSLPSTPSIHCQKQQSNAAITESPSIMCRRFSTATNFSEGEASFDVELKEEAHSSSFTSYHSAGEEEEDMAMMDLTGCVGGILTSSKPPSVAAAKQTNEDETMDFTVCVGGLIRRLPSVRLSDVSNVSSVDTMELTECVGQILSRQQRLHAVEDHTEEQEEDVTMNMEMTTVLPRTIHTGVSTTVFNQQRVASPSPFLVQQSQPTSTGMTFIGDVGEPEAFRLMEGMSPVCAGRDQSADLIEPPQTSEQKNAAEQERLFDALIDTAKCSEEATPIKAVPAPAVSSTPLVSKKNFVSTSTMATPRLQSRSFHVSTLASLPSSPAANRVPAVVLPDFLNQTGIRFLENISSLKRRETTGRPRDSDIVVPAKQAFIAAALVPQLSFFEQAAEDLVPAIVETRELLAQQEAQFAVQPPLALLQWQRAADDPAARQLLLSRLKTLKSVARILAKQHWHAWRLPRQLKLLASMEEAAARAGSAWDPLQRADRHLDTLLTALEPRLEALKGELNSLLHAQAFPDAAEQARQLEAALAAQSAALEAADADLAELDAREAQLRATLATAAAQKQVLAARIEAARCTLAASPRATELALGEARSLLALRKAVSGWEFCQVGPNALRIRYLQGGPVILNLEFDPETRLVTACQMAPCGSPRVALLRHASRFNPRTSVPIAECLSDALARLDALSRLERLLDTDDPTYSFSVIEDDASSMIPFRLGFFSYEARSKFDICMALDPADARMPLAFTTFAHHYGPITQSDVQEYIAMALASSPGIAQAPAACNQIVSSVLGILSEHVVEGRPSDAFSLCMNQQHDMQID